MKAYKRNKTLKYKTTERSLPTFSSAIEASNGVDGVSIAPTNIWSSVGTSVNTNIPNSTGIYYEFYFKDGAKITSLTYKGRKVVNSLPFAGFYGLEAYNESRAKWVSLSTSKIYDTLTTININNNNFYKKYRIRLAGSETNKYANMGVTTINMSGTFRTLVDSNSADYDIVESVDSYYTIKINGACKMIPSVTDNSHIIHNPIITATSGWTNPEYAFDGNLDTYASCGTATDYIQIEYHKPKTVSSIVAQGMYVASGARAMDLRLYSVVDGIETLLCTTTGSTTKATYTTSGTCAKTTASIFRIRLSEKNGDGNAPTTSYKSRMREITLS